MKKLLAFALIFALACPLPAWAVEEETAVATTQTVEVDGRAVTFETYALLDANGFQTNYAKLRDVAYVLNGTAAQFAVDWSSEDGVAIATGQRYTADGSEMSTPYSGDRRCQILDETTAVDGANQAIAAIRLFDDGGNGYTYYKLRDLGSCLGFQVDWTRERGVFIDTSKLYSGVSRADVNALAGTWTGTLDLGPMLAAAAAGQPQFKDYFHFEGATAPVTLTADRTGLYTVSLREEDFDAALAQAKAAYVSGAVNYADELYREELGMTLDQVLTQSGMDRRSFEAEYAAAFDQAMTRTCGELLSRLNRPLPWTADQAAHARTGADAMTLTLGDNTKIDFVRK